MTNERALHVLNTVFGHPAFRGAQQDIVSTSPAAAMRWC